jgi:hypothetical protein
LKKLSLLILLVLSPILAFAKAPDCYNWPMNMTKGWLKNANITNIYNLDESKTKITLLASEKKRMDYIHKFIILFFMIKKENHMKLSPRMKLHMKNAL